MRKVFLFLIFAGISYSAHSQTDPFTIKTRTGLVKSLDSAMRTNYFLSKAEAEKILEKSAVLKDSAYKLSSGVLRYNLDYAAVYVDSTSKGRLTFNFEQYKDTAVARSNYDFIKAENQKDGNFISLKATGNDAFLKKDQLGQPFIMAIKDNKIFKFRVIYLVSEGSQAALLEAAKKIVNAH
jgi:hypothetical protein